MFLVPMNACTHTCLVACEMAEVRDIKIALNVSVVQSATKVRLQKLKEV